MKDLHNMGFQSSFVDTLPGDPEAENFVRQVPKALFSRTEATPIEHPKLLAWSSALAREFDLAPALSGPSLDILAGNAEAPGMKPYAARYGGHQFGNWAGQLGDGRALTLGELQGHSDLWDLQLKGAGPTPYSRRGDGRAVLRSSIREFLCSEAMAALGVPTTRALSLVGSSEQVVRDLFYDGNAAYEHLAIVARMAPSFVRFGNFQILASRGEHAELEQLLRYVWKRHFPALDPEAPETLWTFYNQICRDTATMIAHWQRVGFVHGVMNTDNMSILSLTIDYGPYGWLDVYEPDWTPNTTDAGQRRYRFANQPAVALWNLAQLGEALAVLKPTEAERIDEGMEVYRRQFSDSFLGMMSAKLGLEKIEGDPDYRMIQDLDALLQAHPTDMTIFYRLLSDVSLDAPREGLGVLAPAYYGEPSDSHRQKTEDWLERWARRVTRDALAPELRISRMKAASPKYVLRNYMAQEAIDAAHAGDTSRIQELYDLLQNPYDEQPAMERYFAKRPEWALNKAGCSALSCSS